MKGRQFHKEWGAKCQISSKAIDYAYALIKQPMKQPEYLEYLTRVTEWWDDNDIKYIPDHIRKECKTEKRREKAEQTYKKYLSDHNRGVIPSGLKPNKQAKNKTKLQRWLFHGRKTGRDLSRVEGIGSLQSYVQQKHIQSKGRPFLLAWYLHHLIDYCCEVHDKLVDDIIKTNRDRVIPISPSDYDEIAGFVRQNWKDLKHDFQSH